MSTTSDDRLIKLSETQFNFLMQLLETAISENNKKTFWEENELDRLDELEKLSELITVVQVNHRS